MKKQVTDRLVIVLFFAAPFIWTACGNNNEADSTSAGSDTTNYTPANTTATGGNGTVRFTQDGSQMRMDLQISVPTKANQSVAVHIHEHGDCGDMGKHAGGHWNPTNENHGKWGEGAFHSGDIGNIQLDGSGNGSLQLTSDRWSVGGDAKTDILNKTIIVHNGVDDYKTQPSGNSGDRIGCGIIQRGNP